MTDDETRWKEQIGSIANRRKNVTFSEIERIVNLLGKLGHSIRIRHATHNTLISIDSCRVGVNKHNPGSKQVKSYSVDDFIDAMTELGYYED